MNKAEMAKQERDWQAEADVRTLIEAEKIKKDKTRLATAMKKHKEMVADLMKVKEEK